jgi:hypothetical protein
MFSFTIDLNFKDLSAADGRGRHLFRSNDCSPDRCSMGFEWWCNGGQ